MKITVALMLAIGQLFIGLTSLQAQSKYEKIDAYLTEGAANGFSGSMLIADMGEIVLNKGYGMANKEKGVAYTPKTVSTIGSVTKQFTATAILKLEEMGKLKVTDPISAYFEHLPNDKKDITIHQLLTHSAGLVDVIGRGDFDDIPTDRFFKSLFAKELLHAPGVKYAYSNAGYSILARVIELASGQDYESFLNAHLFEPAGMKQTGYFIPQWEEHSIASGYVHRTEHVGTMIERYRKFGKITWTLKGNGGIHSTPGDMFKWYQALKSHKIISKESFEKLTKPHVREGRSASHYGYGWAIYQSDRNTKIISHNGGNSIFFHDFIWLPEEDVVIILFTNAHSVEAEVAWPIEKMILDENYQAEPIRKDLFSFVFDFLKENEWEEGEAMIGQIEENYSSYIRNSDNLNDLGYKILGTNENAGWAVLLFKLNTELFPEEGNLWDSLGDGYLKNGQREDARRSYERALELAPESGCFWCKNSGAMLRELKKNN